MPGIMVQEVRAQLAAEELTKTLHAPYAELSGMASKSLSAFILLALEVEERQYTPHFFYYSHSANLCR